MTYILWRVYGKITNSYGLLNYFDEIVEIKIDRRNYKIEIKADSTPYIQTYKKEDYERVLSIIEKNT